MAPSTATATLPALPDRAMMTSDELDWLVYSYLEESGYHHTSFSLLHESNLAGPAHNDDDEIEEEPATGTRRNPVMDHVVPPGHLVRLLQKALLYLEAEARYRKDPPEAVPRIVGYPIPTTLPLPPLPKHVPPPTPPPAATATATATATAADTTGDVKGAKGKGSSKPKPAATAGEPSAAAGGELSSTTTKKPKKKVVAAGETSTTAAAAASTVPEAGPSRKAKTPAPSEAAAAPPTSASTSTKQTMGRTNSGGATSAGLSSVAAAPPSSSKGKERAVAATTTTTEAADSDVQMEDATSNSAASRPNGRRTSVSAGAEAPPTTTKRKEKSAAPATTTTTGTVGSAKREREKDDLRPPPAKKSAATLTGSSASSSSGQQSAPTTVASGKRSASPSIPRKSKSTAAPPPPPPPASSSSSDATSVPAASNPSCSSATNPPATSSSASSTSALAGSTTTSSSAPLPPPPPPPPLHPPTTTTSASAPNKFRITTTTKTVSTPVTVSSSSHHHSQSGSSGGGGGGGGGGPPPISAAQLAADKRRRGSGESGATTSGSGSGGKEGDRFHHKIKNEAGGGGGGANDGHASANGAKGKGGGGGGPKSPTKPPSSPLKEFDMRGVREIGADDPRVVRLKGHTVAKVQPCAFNSKVPSLLATGGGDSTCRIWDVPPFTPTDLKSQAAATTVTEHIVCKHQSAQRRCDITCVAWNPSGSLLATGSEDGIVRIWTPSGDLHLVLSMHQRQVCSLKWNPMGTMVLTSSLDQTVCLWEVNSGKVRQQYATHSDTALDVDWNDDQTWASASMDKTVHLMSLSRTTPLHRFRGHRDEVNVVKFSPCGTLVASCSDDSTVRVWSLRNIPALARDIAAKPVKKGDESRRIDRDEEEGGAGGVFVLEGHESDVHQIAWHPDAGKPTASGPRLLASCSFDSTAKLWDADAGTCLYTFARASDYVYSIAFEPVSGRYVATGSNDGRLDIYRVEDRALVTEYKHSGPIYEITWHPHGQQIAVCGQSDIVGVVGFEPSKAA